jgi:peroxiredoxin
MSPLAVGEPAPWFATATDNKRANGVALDELAARHIVLFLFGSARRPDVAEVLSALGRRNDLPEHKYALLLGVGNDPDDFNRPYAHQQHAGQLFLWDSGSAVAKRYGAANPTGTETPSAIRPCAYILNPGLQFAEIIPLTEPTAFVEQTGQC